MATSEHDTRLIQEITLQNILSFGPGTPSLPLHNLNVLIGPNGSGKSNLIECINLLRHACCDMQSAIHAGGGITEWLWKGEYGSSAVIKAVLPLPEIGKALVHSLWFGAAGQDFTLKDETITRMETVRDGQDLENQVYWANESERMDAEVRQTTHVNRGVSVLAQDDLQQCPEVAYLTSAYRQIAIYREWYFGRNAILRKPQSAEMRSDKLEEDFSNLGFILNRLQQNSTVKQTILEHLQDLYDGVTDFKAVVNKGTVRILFTEGKFDIPATRLSSGTLRYLCLLAILCDPTPPPLICIDEPELSLHPDVLPKVADLLLDAATRTQLIVTTHSDILVDAMSEQPECVIVCDKRDAQTVMHRLSQAELAHWLEDFRLGELWTRGELGGTRW